MWIRALWLVAAFLSTWVLPWVLWVLPWQSPWARPLAMAAPYHVRDDLGREIAFDAPPQRVVTMLPSLTETVCALKACERLVATDRYSDWPALVQPLPKVGGLDDVNIELIVSLKPDVVLLSRSSRVAQRLEQLGVRTVAVDSRTYADVARGIRLVGRTLGLEPQAAQLVATIDAEVAAVVAQRQRAAQSAQRPAPKVYFEIDASPYAAGESSFIGELLQRLHTRNIVPRELGPFPKLNPEFVVKADPDLIMLSTQELPHLLQRPGWQHIRAVREQRICAFEAGMRDVIVRPGPRLPEGMRLLAQCLNRWAD